ncbi:hypothetical protein [Pseudoxanthomonas sp. UTMC 1351]|uniref:hypothetical protein n=1 Tax=Pseudoxanthomonas sp. UTMC 1351 TaxID=2695853 RepID=UPI0034CE1A58
MKLKASVFAVVLAITPAVTLAQPSTLTDEDLRNKTERLKLEQAYYDQLAVTQKSRSASSTDNPTTQKAELDAELALKKVELASDFMLAEVLKGGGMTAAAGKEGKTTFASAQSTPLSMKGTGLKLTDQLAQAACEQLERDLLVGEEAFLAPSDYEAKVQASVRDVALFIALLNASDQGYADLNQGVQLQSVTALAGGLAAAQYLAGGVESFSKLFRTDHTITYGGTDRDAIFEQQLSVRCKDRIVPNVTARLRTNAAEIIIDGIQRMSVFAQSYDAVDASYKTELARITAGAAEIGSDKNLTEDEKKKRLNALKLAATKLGVTKANLDKYQAPVDSAKAMLATDMKALGESLIWGQQALVDQKLLPLHASKIDTKSLSRVTYELTVEDGMITSSAMFRSDRIRPVSTAELTYYLRDNQNLPISAGYWTKTSADDTVKMKKLEFNDVENSMKVASRAQPEPEAPAAPAPKATAQTP